MWSASGNIYSKQGNVSVWEHTAPTSPLRRQEEGGHLWEEESVTQALLSARRSFIGTHHLVSVMTNEQIATSTFCSRLSGFDLLIMRNLESEDWGSFLTLPDKEPKRK